MRLLALAVLIAAPALAEPSAEEKAFFDELKSEVLLAGNSKPSSGGYSGPGTVLDVTIEGLGTISKVMTVTVDVAKWKALQPIDRVRFATFAYEWNREKGPRRVLVKDAAGKVLAKPQGGRIVLTD